MFAAAAAPEARADALAEYRAIAERFKSLLPKPLPGWWQTKPVTFVSNSAFQKEMSGKSIYRPKGSTGAGPQVSIFIGAKPGWRASWTEPMFQDEAKAKKQGYEHVTIDGRKFLRREKQENISYVTLLERGITVTFAAKWLKDDQVRLYLSKVDYAAAAKVK